MLEEKKMERNQNRKKHKISYFISLAILLIMLYFAYQFYQTNNFNDFIRSEKTYTPLNLQETKKQNTIIKEVTK